MCTSGWYNTFNKKYCQLSFIKIITIGFVSKFLILDRFNKDMHHINHLVGQFLNASMIVFL